MPAPAFPPAGMACPLQESCAVSVATTLRFFPDRYVLAVYQVVTSFAGIRYQRVQEP